MPSLASSSQWVWIYSYRIKILRQNSEGSKPTSSKCPISNQKSDSRFKNSASEKVWTRVAQALYHWKRVSLKLENSKKICLTKLLLKIRTNVKAPEKQIPRGYKIGRIRSPGRLRDRRRTRDFTDDTLLTMNGAGCQLNKLEINSKFVLPQIQTDTKSPMSAPQIPR